MVRNTSHIGYTGKLRAERAEDAAGHGLDEIRLEFDDRQDGLGSAARRSPEGPKNFGRQLGKFAALLGTGPAIASPPLGGVPGGGRHGSAILRITDGGAGELMSPLCCPWSYSRPRLR